MLWNGIDLVNYSVLKGHNNAVLEIDWSKDSQTLFSASADKSVILWDTDTGKQIKKYKAHKSYVNSISCSKIQSFLFCTGSDDEKVKIWDSRNKKCVSKLKSNYPIFTTCMDLQERKIFSAGLENDIQVWDFRTMKELELLKGHQDSITGISLDPSGDYLLSNSMDQTMRIFDLKPYTKGDKSKKLLYGHSHGIDKNLLRCSWSPKGNFVTGGSSDEYVYIWDVESSKLIYKLPGHKSTINEIVFHPKEPIIASASSDKSIYLGEIEEY